MDVTSLFLMFLCEFQGDFFANSTLQMTEVQLTKKLKLATLSRNNKSRGRMEKAWLEDLF